MADDLTPDWILQSVLGVQNQAHSTWLKTAHPELRPKDDGLTLTVLGCGFMGTAILRGILEHLQRGKDADADSATDRKLASSQPAEAMPGKLPSKFNACVRTEASVERVKASLDKYDVNLTVFKNDNVPAVQEADIILLCCEPQNALDVLTAPGMNKALAGKLLISTCAGLRVTSIAKMLERGMETGSQKFSIVRAVPNAAAAVRESMTVIAERPSGPLSRDISSPATWIFECIGQVVHLPEHMLDASTALCGSGPAFVSLVAESLAAGAIAMGLPRQKSYTMAAQMIRGTAGLLLQGEHPAVLRDKVATPGGCTYRGLGVLEESAIRGAMSKAVRESTASANNLNGHLSADMS